MTSVSLLIGGDLVPTESNFELFSSANIAELFGADLLAVLERADLRVFNLEVPLIDQESPIIKCGPNLIAPTSTINGINRIQANLLTLANNHSLDQGEQGLYSTIRVIEESDISKVGAGYNLHNASQPYIYEKDGIKIGIYACAEHEFTIATKDSAGANPFDPMESLDHIKDLKNNCNYVIALYHGGKENYRYPSPDLQKICRKIANKGANLVVCQHCHCIGAFENYNGCTIVYGQGNFIFDDLEENELWKTSLLINAIISEANMSIEYIPIVKKGNVVRMAHKQQSEEILESFNGRSRQILDEEFVQEEYDKFAAQMLNGYLEKFHGKNIISRLLNKLFRHKRMTRIYSDNDLTTIQNIVECEAHRELVMVGLKNITRK